MSNNSELKYVNVDEIHQSDFQLREVDVESEKYLGIVESMRVRGVLTPILIRTEKNPETGEDQYVLADGAHRLTAAREAGLREIPCKIDDMTELEAMQAQIIANIHRVETKPFEYSRSIKRMIELDPKLTVNMIAESVGRSIQWVKQRIALDKLNPGIGKMVDEGGIDITAAIAIAKLPADKQVEWAERATESTNTLEFVQSVDAYIKARRAAEAQGKDPNAVKAITVKPKLRTITDLDSAIAAPGTVASVLPKGDHTVEDIIALTLKWAMQIDPATYDTRLKEIEVKEEERRKAKAAGSAEANAKKVEELKAKLAKLTGQATA